MKRPDIFYLARITQEGQIADPVDHGRAIGVPCGDVIEGRKRQQGLTEYLGLRPEGAMDIGHIDPSRGGDVAQAGVGIGHPREKQHRRCKNAFFPGCLPRHAVGRVG